MSQVVGGLSVLMALALGFVFWRRRRPGEAQRPIVGVPSPVETLVRELAMLDADFERRADPTAAERDEFNARRHELKARLNAALAEGTRPT